MNPLIAAGDMVVLASSIGVEPEIYGPAQFMALFFLAVHAHFQGSGSGSWWACCRRSCWSRRRCSDAPVE